MPDNFPAYIETVLVLEGGGVLTNDPDDPGGATIWGITAATAAAAGYRGTLATLTKSQAITIYRSLYWQLPGFDKVDPIFPDLASYLLNVGVNLGPSTPVRFLQRALNALGNNGSLYPRLLVDGVCGPMTLASLSGYLHVRPISQNGPAVLIGMLRSLIAVNYVAIVETTPTEATFAYGWIRDRALGLLEVGSQASRMRRQ